MIFKINNFDKLLYYGLIPLYTADDVCGRGGGKNLNFQDSLNYICRYKITENNSNNFVLHTCNILMYNNTINGYLVNVTFLYNTIIDDRIKNFS